jgi:hypothetical protein
MDSLFERNSEVPSNIHRRNGVESAALSNYHSKRTDAEGENRKEIFAHLHPISNGM